MANKLKAITSLAKKIRKRHPNKHRKWTNYVKEAASKLAKPTRKRKPAVKKATRKRTVRRKAVRSTMGKTTTMRVRRKTVYKVRRVGARRAGSGGFSLTPLLVLAGVGIVGYKLLSKKKEDTPNTNTEPLPQIRQTSNPVRDQASNDIVQWAQAAGIAVNALAELIKSLNSKSDAEVISMRNNIDGNGGGGTPYTYDDDAEKWLY